jgi:hypothetical protein
MRDGMQLLVEMEALIGALSDCMVGCHVRGEGVVWELTVLTFGVARVEITRCQNQ